MSVSVLNTDAGLTAKTLMVSESAQTITGAKTFDLDPSAPFIVTAGSAVVTNLNADQVDGYEASGLARLDSANTFSSATPIICSNASGGIRERNRSVQMGEWTSVAWADANFTGDGTDGNWVVDVGDQQVFRYSLCGKTLFIAITIVTSTVANTPTELRFVIPGGSASGANAGGTFFYSENGTAGIGRWYCNGGESAIRLVKAAGTFSNQTNLTTIQAAITMEVA